MLVFSLIWWQVLCIQRHFYRVKYGKVQQSITRGWVKRTVLGEKKNLSECEVDLISLRDTPLNTYVKQLAWVKFSSSADKCATLTCTSPRAAFNWCICIRIPHTHTHTFFFYSPFSIYLLRGVERGKRREGRRWQWKEGVADSAGLAASVHSHTFIPDKKEYSTTLNRSS